MTATPFTFVQPSRPLLPLEKRSLHICRGWTIPSLHVAMTSHTATSSRRSFLRTAGAVLVSFSALRALPALARIETKASEAGYTDPGDVDELETRAGSATVTLATFKELLENGDVSRVWFFGALNEKCYFESAGKIQKIGEGYPTESSRSPESPLWIMAKVRDRNVPFTLSPIASRFLRRKKPVAETPQK